MTTKTFSSAEHQFTFKAAAIPQLRTDRLLDYLTSVGISDSWLTKNVQPLLKRWAEPKEFFDVLRGVPLTEARSAKVDVLEKLLKNLFRHQVRDWLEAVAESDEENTPARDLSDTLDRWTEHASAFGRAMLNVRAVEHEGEILFLADDVAKIYGGSYADEPQEFLRSVARPLCNHVKKYTIKKLNYQEILAASPSAVADKMSLRRGKWFLNKTLVLFCQQQSKTKPAMAFRTYLIELETQADVQHKVKKVKARSAARQTQLKVYPKWKGNVEAHGANLIDANGEVFYHVTDGEYSTQEAYCAEHGIDKPFAEKLPDEIIQDTNLIREVTMKMADTQRVRGKYAYSSVIARAADAVDLLSEHPEALAVLAASKGISHTPRFKRRAN